jgi:hypothetical protein
MLVGELTMNKLLVKHLYIFNLVGNIFNYCFLQPIIINNVKKYFIKTAAVMGDKTI